MIFLRVMVAILSSASFLFAQVNGSTAENQTGTKAQEKAGVMKLYGKVVSVDVKANTIIVKTKKAVDTLNVASGAQIMRGMMELSKTITLGDLQTDALVAVTWEMIDGTKTATKIEVKSDADSKWEKATH